MVVKSKLELREETAGIRYWMERALVELDKAQQDLAPDPVHDLRVALRRCRSMAEGFQTIDPDPTWRRMRKACKAIFAPLGELRDTQVMIEWVTKLGKHGDTATESLLRLFEDRERQQKIQLTGILPGFDRKQWRQWAEFLSSRANQIPRPSPVFEYLALERWENAHELHRTALRNRSQTAYHQLRIGLKKLRYVTENFLPEHHQRWGKDLKELQDALGEVHDLDVLWGAAVASGFLAAAEVRAQWRTRIVEERELRIDAYRRKMVGKASLWPVWRAELPAGDMLQKAILERFRILVHLMNAEPDHVQRVTGLTLQLYDQLCLAGFLVRDGGLLRVLVEAASLLHAIGRTKRNKDYHKISARMIGRMNPPIGWRASDLQIAALIARYHRGSLPSPRQNRFGQLSPEQQKLTEELAGVLRLTETLDRTHQGGIRKIAVERTPETLVLHVEGYDAENRAGEEIAAARYLLERTVGLPIVITSNQRSAQKSGAQSLKPFTQEQPAMAHRAFPSTEDFPG